MKDPRFPVQWASADSLAGYPLTHSVGTEGGPDGDGRHINDRHQRAGQYVVPQVLHIPGLTTHS
jgi:hypothetical protein